MNHLQMLKPVEFRLIFKYNDEFVYIDAHFISKLETGFYPYED